MLRRERLKPAAMAERIARRERILDREIGGIDAWEFVEDEREREGMEFQRLCRSMCTAMMVGMKVMDVRRHLGGW